MHRESHARRPRLQLRGHALEGGDAASEQAVSLGGQFGCARIVYVMQSLSQALGIPLYPSCTTPDFTHFVSPLDS